MNQTFTLVDQHDVIATGLTLAEAHSRLSRYAEQNDLALHLHTGSWAGTAVSTGYLKHGCSLLDAKVWVRLARPSDGPAPKAKGKAKLVVKTDVGTFTRTTARTYTHVVIAKGVKAEVLEAERLAALKDAREQQRQYRAILAGNKTIGLRSHPVSRAWDIECRDKSLADGSYTRYLADVEARIAKLEAQGPITEDQGTGWVLLGWCGRPDLAFRKVTEQGRAHYYDSAARFREARAYALDGTRSF